MNILVTGRGTSGSWAIRGQQLGAAIGATVEANATKLHGYDLAIVVKKLPEDALQRLRRAKVPIVYDIVDGWPQPYGNDWGRATCMEWLQGQIARIQPIALVAATNVMAMDCAELGLPVLALPHHARQGQVKNPIRDQVNLVDYEGGRYLGRWSQWFQIQCEARGWRFVVNPERLADLDIVVALREVRGYAPQHWKSNVKLANAQGSGTPCIVGHESGYEETKSGGEFFADTEPDVERALSILTDWQVRQHAQDKLLPAAPNLALIATEYKTWFSQLKF